VSFIWPNMLLLLLAIPLLVGLYIRLQNRRKQLAANYASFTGSPIQNRQPGRLRHVPPLLFLAGMSLLLTALARPQMTVNLPRIEGTVILAFDVSGSMAAEDLKPNRLEAAKESARAFVQRQPPHVRFGVVAFSEGGLPVQIPTGDREAVLASINRLEPQRGTSIGYGILTALNAIFEDPSELSDSEAEQPEPVPAVINGQAIIVLLTDGENTTNPDPFEAAFSAAERGVRIYPIGIGSPEGAILNIDGFTVHTQLNEFVLEQIAGLTGGEYYPASSEESFREIYDHISPELVIRPEPMEITSILAGLSILILLLGGGLMLMWFGRLP
jgi:Ca-activated chloride channel homolog